MSGSTASGWPSSRNHICPTYEKDHLLEVVLEVARAGIEPATFRFSGGRDSH